METHTRARTMSLHLTLLYQISHRIRREIPAIASTDQPTENTAIVHRTTPIRLNMMLIRLNHDHFMIKFIGIE